MKSRFFLFIFALAVIGIITGIFLQNNWLEFIFKPLIMLSLCGHFLANATRFQFKTKVFGIWAILFSLFGDTALMFSGKNQLFFIVGLGCFLISQVGYIALFQNLNTVSGTKSYLKSNPFWLILFLIYGSFIYWLLFASLDSVMKIAVFVYMVALLSMSAMALNRKGVKPESGFWLVFAGSLLFVVSDSIIAINKFLHPVQHSDFFVMSTYMAAQYLIVSGILKQTDK